MKWMWCIIACFLSFFALTAQDEKIDNFIQKIEIGVLAGAEVSRNTGDFKFAYAGRYTGSYQVSSYFSIGGGLGYERYDDITLIPIFIDAHAFLKPQLNTSYFSFQIGYAPGWHDAYRQLDNYNFQGGFFTGFNYGRRIPIKNDINFLIDLGLKFQQTEVEINNTFLDDYEEKINYILLNFRTGISF